MSVVKYITKYWLKLWLAALVVIVIGSLTPALAPPSHGPLPLDKIFHFAAYGVLALLPMVQIIRRKVAFIATAGVPVIGMFLEYAQKGVAGREFSPDDMIANNLGALLGILIGMGLRLNRRGLRQRDV